MSSAGRASTGWSTWSPQQFTSARHASGQSRCPTNGAFGPQPTGTFGRPAMVSRDRVVRTPTSQSDSPVPGRATAKSSTPRFDAR